MSVWHDENLSRGTAGGPGAVRWEMGRKQRQPLDARQLRFAQGLAEGKTKIQAARDAGYAETTCLKKSFGWTDRPLVRSLLSEALLRQGVTMDAIVKPIVEGLEAKARILTEAGLVETDLPDHKIRGENADRAVRLFGGIPREVEMPAPARPGLVVNIIRMAAKSDPKVVNEPIEATPTKANGQGARLHVTIRRAGSGNHNGPVTL